MGRFFTGLCPCLVLINANSVMPEKKSRLQLIREEKQKKNEERRAAVLARQTAKLVVPTDGSWDEATIREKIETIEKRIATSNEQWDKKKAGEDFDKERMISGKLQRKLLGRLVWLRHAAEGRVQAGGAPASQGRKRKSRPLEHAVKQMRRDGEKCLRCGSPGHVLELCRRNRSKGEDRCFNCGSSEHRLRDCPQNRKKHNFLEFAQCFLCGEVGHLSAQCGEPPKKPETEEWDGKCFVCGSSDHLKADCPNVDDKCFACGSPDHRRAECPNNTFLCFVCKKPGHNRANCPEKPQDADGCYHCGETSHVRKFCPALS